LSLLILWTTCWVFGVKSKELFLLQITRLAESLKRFKSSLPLSAPESLKQSHVRSGCFGTNHLI